MHYTLAQSLPQAEVVCAFDINTVANDVYEHNHGMRPYQVNCLMLTHAYCVRAVHQSTNILLQVFHDLSASSNACVLKVQMISARQLVGEAAECSLSKSPPPPPPFPTLHLTLHAFQAPNS